jgi:hypothetical protein
MSRRVSVVVAIVGLSLMGCCCCWQVPNPPAAQQARKEAEGNRRGANPDFANVIAKGKIVLDTNGTLAAKDAVDPSPALQGKNARMKVHEVSMQPGKTYVITLDSNDFDAYLRVESPNGEQVAEDDDSGDGFNAKIVFRPEQAGMFRVIATSFNGRLGRYHLKVQEAN